MVLKCTNLFSVVGILSAVAEGSSWSKVWNVWIFSRVQVNLVQSRGVCFAMYSLTVVCIFLCWSTIYLSLFSEICHAS